MLPPIIKPKKNIEITPTVEPAEKDSDNPGSELLFTAVGIISGVVEFVEDTRSATITVGGNKYPLFYIPNNKGSVAFDALRKNIASTGNNNYRLIVYPKVIHFPGRDKPHHTNSRIANCSCISIFKNFTEQRLEYIKLADITKRVKFMKASHIPLFWKDALVPPFRFNPKAPKEEQGRPYFVSIIARVPSLQKCIRLRVTCKGCHYKRRAPFLKASKKMKAEALSLRKGEAAPQKEAVTENTQEGSKFTMPIKRNKADCN